MKLLKGKRWGAVLGVDGEGVLWCSPSPMPESMLVVQAGWVLVEGGVRARALLFTDTSVLQSGRLGWWTRWWACGGRGGGWLLETINSTQTHNDPQVRESLTK